MEQARVLNLKQREQRDALRSPQALSFVDRWN